jgi:hypothetical protein
VFHFGVIAAAYGSEYTFGQRRCPVPILAMVVLAVSSLLMSLLTPSVVSQADHLLLSAVRARVTFSRMSLALAVQMKGLGF